MSFRSLYVATALLALLASGIVMHGAYTAAVRFNGRQARVLMSGEDAFLRNSSQAGRSAASSRGRYNSSYNSGLVGPSTGTRNAEGRSGDDLASFDDDFGAVEVPVPSSDNPLLASTNPTTSQAPADGDSATDEAPLTADELSMMIEELESPSPETTEPAAAGENNPNSPNEAR